MLEKLGNVIRTDVLVIGGGAGGLWAGLSAKRHNPSINVTVVDAHMVGRSGHAAFSNAWMAVVTPDDDLVACAREIVEGNEWIADQELIYDILALSYDQLLDLEKMGLEYPKDNGKFIRRPTRGLELIRVLKPNGGGLEFCWALRKALEKEGVAIVEQIFVTDLLSDESGSIAGAVGVNCRTREFFIIQAKSTILATNTVSFRSGFVRDLTGTGPILAYRAGATLTNAEFGYLRPGTPRFYFEGITYAIQDGAKFRNAKDEAFMERYDTKWGDKADVHSITKAMVMEKQAGNAPLYLDMSLIPEEKRDDYLTSTVAWMDFFYKKLGERARIDMFSKTEYFPIYQITKMGIKTDSKCCSEIKGLFAAGLAQVACATHFAELHIAACNGTGWISGKSAVQYAEEINMPEINESYVSELKAAIASRCDDGARIESDDLLLALQKIIFRYDISMLKSEERLVRALAEVTAIKDRIRNAKAPHTHEFVRLNETDCMIDTAEMILRASLARKETRLSHIREDYPNRDDDAWIKWILIKRADVGPEISTAPVARPLFP
jgi:succinate dehydrogenase/fumarate reductase flavoprotein subunit